MRLENRNYELLANIRDLQYYSLLIVRMKILSYKKLFDEVNFFIKENTFIFENSHIKQFNLECLALIIDENRSLREQLTSESEANKQLNEEVRRLKTMAQYYPGNQNGIIFEDEFSKSFDTISCASQVDDG